MKTLIVEDDFLSRFILQKMLLPFGQTDVVVNGKEAIQAFAFAMQEQSPYDLICLDIMMPELDGRETLKLIRKYEQEHNVGPEKEAKILMVTALDTAKEVIDAYYRGGCSAYLVKPIEREILYRRLVELGFSIGRVVT